VFARARNLCVSCMCVALSSWIFILVHRFPRYPCERHLYVSVYVCKVPNSLRLTDLASLSRCHLPSIFHRKSARFSVPPFASPDCPLAPFPPAALTLMVHRSDGRQVRGGSKNNLTAHLYIQTPSMCFTQKKKKKNS